MGKMSKLKKSVLFLTTYAHTFKCPLCATAMQIKHPNILVCLNNHAFDIAKQGYLNMLTNQSQTHYDQALFEARQAIVMQHHFFNPLTEKLTHIIRDHVTKAKPKEPKLVDLGTGEGALFNIICNQLQKQTEITPAGFGLDISKAGIMAATKNENSPIMWLVADLVHPPFQANTFDVLLNILSPSNYTTFNHLLKDDGMVIKVVPRPDYLRELRDFFHAKSPEQAYTNDQVVENFKKQFHIEASHTVQYKKQLDQAALQALIQMTPLTWHADKSSITTFLETGITDMTVDLDILVGRKK